MGISRPTSRREMDNSRPELFRNCSRNSSGTVPEEFRNSSPEPFPKQFPGTVPGKVPELLRNSSGIGPPKNSGFLACKRLARCRTVFPELFRNGTVTELFRNCSGNCSGDCSQFPEQFPERWTVCSGNCSGNCSGERNSSCQGRAIRH